MCRVVKCLGSGDGVSYLFSCQRSRRTVVEGKPKLCALLCQCSQELRPRLQLTRRDHLDGLVEWPVRAAGHAQNGLRHIV